MKLSIVTTLYNSQDHVRQFFDEASAAAKIVAGDDYEIIMVNDGSPDNSLEVAQRILQSSTRLKIVDLSRNFGHHKAMMAALSFAKGSHVFLIDSDLEEKPDLLLPFWEEMSNKKCDVAYGVQGSRRGGFFERWSGEIFYRIFNFLSGMSLTENIITARLMTRRYIDALLKHEEREIFIDGLWELTGFLQMPVTVIKRSTSKTTYTFKKKMSLAVNSITSFSNAPLVAIFYIGASIFLISLFYVFYVVCGWIFFESPVSGWTSLIASIWIIGGMVISFLGVIGIYLSKVFSETKQRPNTIVRQIYERQEP